MAKNQPSPEKKQTQGTRNKPIHASNRAKYEQLGMPFGTASARLRKQLFLLLLRRLGEDTCYRCGGKIETAAELSIDHKTPWLHVNADLFWDTDNVAFSHRGCNKVDRPSNGSVQNLAPPGACWCCGCQQILPLDHFYPSVAESGKLAWLCRQCTVGDKQRRESSRRSNGKCPCGRDKPGNRKLCDTCREYRREQYYRRIAKEQPGRIVNKRSKVPGPGTAPGAGTR